MNPIIVAAALALAGCLMDPEPKTRVIHCGTLGATDDVDAPADTFVVVDGKCGSTSHSGEP